MKVLHINTASTRGGAALAATNINNALNKMVVDSWLLNARESANPEGKVLSLGESNLRLKINALAYRLFGIEGFTNLGLWKHWVDELDQYDLIHLHNVHGYYMPFEVLLILLSKPCVWTLHDFWLVTGGPASPLSDKPSKSFWERAVTFANFSYPAEWIDRSHRRRTKLLSVVAEKKPTIVVPSHNAADCLRDLGLNFIPLNVISHGFFGAEPAPNDADRKSARMKRGWPIDKHVFLFASATIDNQQKGFDIFLEALLALPQPAGWVAFVAGGHSAQAQAKASETNIDLRFLGMLGNEEMKECFRACDTYVTPTLSETFGMTVVEALAEGSQVVCSDLPVLREVTGADAIFFPPGDSKALSEELRRLIGKTDKQDRVVVATNIRERFSNTRMAQEYFNLYQRVINPTPNIRNLGVKELFQEPSI